MSNSNLEQSFNVGQVRTVIFVSYLPTQYGTVYWVPEWAAFVNILKVLTSGSCGVELRCLYIPCVLCGTLRKIHKFIKLAVAQYPVICDAEYISRGNAIYFLREELYHHGLLAVIFN